MIEIGNNPEKEKGFNKFIAQSGDGMRGKIVAIHQYPKKAIILAMNTSIKEDVEWGKFYLIKEREIDQYPFVVRQVMKIPNNEMWRII